MNDDDVMDPLNDDGLLDPSSEAFRRDLSRWKRLGCNLLITGNVREEVSQRMTQKLLGAPEAQRTRILALTDQDRTDVPDLLPGDVGPSDARVHVVDHGCGTRAADARTPSQRRWRRQSLDNLQTNICNAITTAKIAESGFNRAELRLSLFTLSYLVNTHEPAAIDRFVSTIGDHVRGVCGMAHCHLPIADDSKVVQRLSPLFDARIELREKHGLPEQRWHLSDSDVPTSWFEL